MKGYEFVNESGPERNYWPFREMSVGQTVRFESQQERAQQYAHTYAHQAGWKFKTWRKDGFMFVQRVA